MTTSYDPNDARLTAYALGELDEAGRAEIESLLTQSPELQAELAEIANLVGVLRNDLVSEPVPELTASQRQELTAQPVQSAHKPTSSRPTRFRSDIAWWCGVAAACVLLVVVIRSSKDTSVPPDRFTAHSATVADSSDSMAQASRSDSRIDYAGGKLIQDHPEGLSGGGGFGGGMGGFRGGQMGRGEPRDQMEADRDLPKARPAESSKSAETGSVTTSPVGHPVDGLSQVSSPNNKSSTGLSADSPKPDSSTPSKPDVRFEGVDAKPDSGKGDQAPAITTVQQGDSQAENLAKNKDGAESKFHSLDQPPERERARIKAKPSSGESRTDALAIVEAESKRIPGSPRDAGWASADLEGNETYEASAENQFVTPSQQPLSTFSIDVDSASYSNVRRFITQGQLPPRDAVRIEEMINYFHYDYPSPKNNDPFSVIADAAPCPWQREHYLARIALKARTIDKAKRPPTNLVFLLDVSGSMQPANKLPLVKQAMTMLVEELNDRDRIAIVTYAGDAGVKLASTRGSDQTQIMQAIDALHAGGSTNGAAGINLAYEQALQNFNGEGENRVILCTDGDFNVGVSSDDQLVQLIEQQAKSKVFLSIFGFGMGNLKDAKLEKLADKGNGHYGYIDDLREARRVFNEELVGTLYTVAKDVKIQVEFNPLTVGAYRLIGYENRTLAAKDFNDDTKDAGEIGAGHTVTALYEIVPKGQWPKTQAVDPLKYGNAKDVAPPADPVKPNVPAESADDLFTLKLRFKQPTADTSTRTIDYVVDDIAGKNVTPAPDFLWAASVASFGMQLKQSQFKGRWTLNDVFETAQGARGEDANGRRREFLDLIQATQRLNGNRSRPAAGF